MEVFLPVISMRRFHLQIAQEKYETGTIEGLKVPGRKKCSDIAACGSKHMQNFKEEHTEKASQTRKLRVSEGAANLLACRLSSSKVCSMRLTLSKSTR